MRSATSLSHFLLVRFDWVIGMFSLSRSINMRGGLLPITCLMLAATSSSAVPQAAQPIAGTWRGRSVCAVPNTPCRDEVNVYRFSEIEGKVNHFSCIGSRIVAGTEVVMGTTEWIYDSSKHTLQTVTVNPTIQLKLDNDTLDGVLVLADKTVYRRIHLNKSSN